MTRGLLAVLMIGLPTCAWAQAERDFSFSPSVSLQYDIGAVDPPDRIDAADEGTLAAFRRFRFGGAGVAAALKYKVEFDVAGSDFAILDAYFDHAMGPVRLRAGNMKTGIALVEETSSRSGSFVERPAFVQAFAVDRRFGAQLRYVQGDVTLWGGVFADDLDLQLSSGGALWLASGRAVWAPRLGQTQLHFGIAAQRADFDDAPIDVRYRRRPNFNLTNRRFVDTGNLGVRVETLAGVEAAFVSGPFYGAAAAYRAMVDRPTGDLDFDSGYVEAGWSLTGEPRPYADGKFDRPKVARPITQGGPGGLLLAARYDWIDLDDSTVRGGAQQALGAALTWTPVDLLRLTIDYEHIMVDGGPFAPAFIDGDFTAHVIASRIQFAF